MSKKFVLMLSAAALCFTGAASAEVTTPIQTAQTTTAAVNQTEMGSLIGRSVHNTAGDRIGDINAVYVGKDGKVKNVIVGVGGFLGIAEHDVALGWSKLKIMEKDVTIDISKDELKAMPKFEYPKAMDKGTVIYDRG